MVDMTPPRRPPISGPAPGAPNTSPASKSSSAPFNRGGYSSSDYNPTETLDAADFRPVPNPIGDLFQPTYHFKFMLPPEDYTMDEVDPPHVVIAETGATGLNISDVEIDAIVGPNINTRNTIGTRVTMTIVEPFGARLPDLLFEAAKQMKIKNYTKAPWLLELQLLGYDRNGNKVVLNNQTWRWQLLLLNIDSKISEGATVHTVEAIPLAEHALTNQAAVLASAVTVEGKKVGEILKEVIVHLNREADQKYGEGFLEYAVEDVPYSGATAVVSPFEHEVTSSTPDFDDARNQGWGQFSPGTDFPSIVDAVMSASRTAAEQSRLSRSIQIQTLGEDPESTDIKNVNSILHRVETKTELTGYHPLYGDYARKITFIIRPYDTVRLVTSAGNATEFMTNSKLKVGKAKYAIDNFYLSKMYEYIYTGMNTEVEKFDINVNFNWTVAVPLLMGHVHYGTSTVPKFINEANRFQEVVRSSRETLQKLREDAEKTETTRDDEAIDNAEARIDAVVQRQRSDFNRRHIEELRPEDFNVDDTYVEATLDAGASSEKFQLPITVIQEGDNPDAATNFGVSSQSHEGRSLYGSLLNQMYGAFDGNMQNIELTIRGDPYWLGPTKENAAGNQIPNNDQDESEQPAQVVDDVSTADRPAFNTAEHMFVFRFKIPLGERDDIDTSDGLGTSDAYTGFYATTKVLHKFSEGKFTQVLTGIRVMGWDIGKMLRILD